MSDDELKPLLEKLCALSEQQLAKMSESLERYSQAREKDQKLQELWERQLKNHEESQKTYEQRAERHERDVRIRGIITLIIWAVTAIAIVVHFFF